MGYLRSVWKCVFSGRCIATMVCGGFFLSFCFGRMASIVGRLDAERNARSEKVSRRLGVCECITVEWSMGSLHDPHLLRMII